MKTIIKPNYADRLVYVVDDEPTVIYHNSADQSEIEIVLPDVNAAWNLALSIIDRHAPGHLDHDLLNALHVHKQHLNVLPPTEAIIIRGYETAISEHLDRVTGG